jgi:glycosyltransferase involved in cell wall biosynthesis
MKDPSKLLNPNLFSVDKIKEKPLHIVWIIISYVPDKNSGAECMTHAINQYLLTKGWTATVITPKHSKQSYEGVKIVEFSDTAKVKQALYEASVLVSYLHYQTLVAEIANTLQKPYIAIHHNSFQIPYTRDILRILPPQNFYIVNNSIWLHRHYEKAVHRVPELKQFAPLYPSHSFVLYPPVNYRDFSFPVEGTYVTLVNCSKEKGGDLLIQLAKALPAVPFLGVLGSYNKQVQETLPNLTYIKNTKDIESFYKKTHIILMPSVYESWGRVAVEAMSLGIPVIAHPTPGLRESLGDAGLFANRTNPDHWVSLIRALRSNPWFYERKSMEGKIRAKELDPLPQLQTFELWLRKIHWTN